MAPLDTIRASRELFRVYLDRYAYRAATLHILLGAALCLLLAACANVASLELANGLRRARAYSVQMALGASRSWIVRIGILEAACLVGFACAGAWGLAVAGAPLLTSFLPETITLGGIRPIDVEGRTLAFLASAAAGVPASARRSSSR